MVAAKYSVDNRIFNRWGRMPHSFAEGWAGCKCRQSVMRTISPGRLRMFSANGPILPFLHTYETERRSYAQDLIAFDKIIAESLDGGTAAQYQSLVHERNMFTSGIGIKYQSSLTRDVGLPRGNSH
ncbi:hypothetical protein B0H10DRAFT_1137791 [Mycena sp. CBHHK59/15]|nr:hypothetical protein B0H10DRAFT_1137791 [Mycena sp. CBHHK59/15]